MIDEHDRCEQQPERVQAVVAWIEGGAKAGSRNGWPLHGSILAVSWTGRRSGSPSHLTLF
jgi:hypothetical protein